MFSKSRFPKTSKPVTYFQKKAPRFLKKLKFKVNFSYLFKIIIDENLNTHLLVYNEPKVNYDVTRR